MRTVTAVVCACIVLSIVTVSDARAGGGGTERISVSIAAGQLQPRSDLDFVAAPSFEVSGRARVAIAGPLGLTGAVSRSVLSRGERIAPVMDLQLGLIMAGLSVRAHSGPLMLEISGELGTVSLRVSAPKVPRSHHGLAARAGLAAGLALTPSLRVGLRIDRLRGTVALPQRRYFDVGGTSLAGFVEARW
ncbi:MAG TPA: hypothetical protein VML75_13575 [Kofleriaceae bacterium]|nr:hypothetical protein [Kofleriaceae bacterium]